MLFLFLMSFFKLFHILGPWYTMFLFKSSKLILGTWYLRSFSPYSLFLMLKENLIVSGIFSYVNCHVKLLIVKSLCLSKSKTFNSWSNGSVGWLRFLYKIFLTAFCKFFWWALNYWLLHFLKLGLHNLCVVEQKHKTVF